MPNLGSSAKRKLTVGQVDPNPEYKKSKKQPQSKPGTQGGKSPAKSQNVTQKMKISAQKGKSPVKSPPKLKVTSIQKYFTQTLAIQQQTGKDEPWCFICQMPFELKLSFQSNETHMESCMEMNFDKIPSCPQGLTCNSLSRSHYLKFNHRELAKLRANLANNPPHLVEDHPMFSSESSIGHDQMSLEVSAVNEEREFDESEIFAENGNEKKLAPANGKTVRSTSSNWSDVSKMFQEPLQQKQQQQKCIQSQRDTHEQHNLEQQRDERATQLPRQGSNSQLSESSFSHEVDPLSSPEPETSKAGYRSLQKSPDRKRPAQSLVDISGLGSQSEEKTNPTIAYLGDVNSNDPSSNSVEILSEGNPLQKNMDQTTTGSDRSSYWDQDNPIRINALERISGSLHIEVKVKPSNELDKLVMVIPKSNQEANSGNKMIDVLGRFRGQSNIQSFFKNTSLNASNPAEPTKDNIHPFFKNLGSNPQRFLSNKEKIEARKKVEKPQQNNKKSYSRDKPYSRDGPTARGPCPFYRKIANSSYTVDAFYYGYIEGCTKYFLSHFHYDHYRGLSKHWTGFPIYCSQITARLLQLKLRVDPKWIKPLDLDVPYIVDTNVELRLLDANHCPGSVMFLFKFLTTGQVVLHCGDFRACPEMESSPSLWNCTVNKVYLDTTYCQPDYDFPSQYDVITKTVDIVKQHLILHPRTLICVGSYTIGKERIFMAIAEALDCKIFAATEKARVLKTLQDPIIEKRLTSLSSSARVHVVEMGKVRNRAYQKEYLSQFSDALYNKVLSIVPTGWTHDKGSSSKTGLEHLAIKKSGPDLFQCDVPYSEHSSFSELRRFVKFLKLSSPDNVIPTVNVGNPEYRNSMKSLFKQWVHGT